MKSSPCLPLLTPVWRERREDWVRLGYEVTPTSTTLNSCLERETGRLGETRMKSSPRPALSAPVWRERWDDWVRLEAHQPNSGPMVSTLYPVWYNGGSEEPMDGKKGARIPGSTLPFPVSPTESEEKKGEWRDPCMKDPPETHLPCLVQGGRQDACPNHPDLHFLPARRNVWKEKSGRLPGKD